MVQNTTKYWLVGGIFSLFRCFTKASKKLRQPKVSKKAKRVAWILRENNQKEEDKSKELHLRRDLAVFSRLKTWKWVQKATLLGKSKEKSCRRTGRPESEPLSLLLQTSRINFDENLLVFFNFQWFPQNKSATIALQIRGYLACVVYMPIPLRIW